MFHTSTLKVKPFCVKNNNRYISLIILFNLLRNYTAKLLVLKKGFTYLWYLAGKRFSAQPYPLLKSYNLILYFYNLFQLFQMYIVPFVHLKKVCIAYLKYWLIANIFGFHTIFTKTFHHSSWKIYIFILRGKILSNTKNDLLKKNVSVCLMWLQQSVQSFLSHFLMQRYLIYILIWCCLDWNRRANVISRFSFCLYSTKDSGNIIDQSVECWSTISVAGILSTWEQEAYIIKQCSCSYYLICRSICRSVM